MGKLAKSVIENFARKKYENTFSSLQKMYLSRQRTLNLVDYDLACKRKFSNHEVIDKCARVFGNYPI